MFKKTGLILLALTLAAGMVFVGCTGNSGPDSEWEITSGFKLSAHGSQAASVIVNDSDRTVKMANGSVNSMAFGIIFPTEANPDGYTWDMYSSFTVEIEIYDFNKGKVAFIIKSNGTSFDDATMVDDGNKYPQIGSGNTKGDKATTDPISKEGITDRVVFQHNHHDSTDIDYTVKINKITFIP